MDDAATFEQGDQVVLISGSPPMTVSYTFVDDRYETRTSYAKLTYYNPVTGLIETKSLKVALLKRADS